MGLNFQNEDKKLRRDAGSASTLKSAAIGRGNLKPLDSPTQG
jgi:hypothetical protein